MQVQKRRKGKERKGKKENEKDLSDSEEHNELFNE